MEFVLKRKDEIYDWIMTFGNSEEEDGNGVRRSL